MNKKYFFFDIDGTLTDKSTGKIVPSAQVALNELQKTGHFVAIATGRAHYKARNFMQSVGLHDMVCCGGGGLVIHDELVQNIPLNLEKHNVDLINTGQWTKKALKEHEKLGKVNVVASSAEDNFTYIPKIKQEDLSEDSDYVYICENNTIYGTKYKELPPHAGKLLVADLSSCILSERCDVSKYVLPD